MAKGTTLTVVFKADRQHQVMLLPPSLEELIALHHPVRVVNEILEKVDISAVVKKYKPGGTSSYHPRMLLKVMVYAYINNIYSSRKIEEALIQNINFMWHAQLYCINKKCLSYNIVLAKVVFVVWQKALHSPLFLKRIASIR
jgi:transposase